MCFCLARCSGWMAGKRRRETAPISRVRVATSVVISDVDMVGKRAVRLSAPRYPFARRPRAQSSPLPAAVLFPPTWARDTPTDSEAISINNAAQSNYSTSSDLTRMLVQISKTKTRKSETIALVSNWKDASQREKSLGIFPADSRD